MKNKLVLCCILASVCFAPMLPAQTLLSQEIKDVDATSDVTINASLPAAPAPFSLSGTVTGATFVFGYVTAQSSTGGIYTGNIDPATNTYRVLVPGGTYTLSVDYFDSQYTDVTFADPVPVTVSADTVRDINITLTPRFQLTGNITGVDPRLSSRLLSFYSDTVSQSSDSGDIQIASDGTYRTQLSSGTYTAVLNQSGGDLTQHSVAFLGTVTINGAATSMDFAAPPLSALSGTVFTGSLWSIPRFIILGVPLNPTPGSPESFAGGGSGSDGSGAYQLLLPTGTYQLAAFGVLPLPQGFGYLILLQLATVRITGDGRQDVTLPSAPGTVTISGQVTDSNGNGVGGVLVEATTQELATIPNAGFSTSTTSKLDGTYQLTVFSGTNYDIAFTPPAGPFPSSLSTNRQKFDLKKLLGKARAQKTSSSAR